MKLKSVKWATTQQVHKIANLNEKAAGIQPEDVTYAILALKKVSAENIFLWCLAEKNKFFLIIFKVLVQRIFPNISINDVTAWKLVKFARFQNGGVL